MSPEGQLSSIAHATYPLKSGKESGFRKDLVDSGKDTFTLIQCLSSRSAGEAVCGEINLQKVSLQGHCTL